LYRNQKKSQEKERNCKWFIFSGVQLVHRPVPWKLCSSRKKALGRGGSGEPLDAARDGAKAHGYWVGDEAAHYGEWQGRRGCGREPGGRIAVENWCKCALVAGMEIHEIAI